MNHAETVNIEEQQQRLSLMSAIVTLSLRVLAERIILLLVLLLDAGIFAWAMRTESVTRLAGAVLFAVAAHCLIHWRPRAQESKNET
jgi:hypothetical protein